MDSLNSTPITTKQILILIGAVCLAVVMVALVYFSPINTGGDWNILTRALRGWSAGGEELYRLLPANEGRAVARYVYSPFATLLLLPFVWLPVRLTWAIMAITNNLILLVLCRKYEIGRWTFLLLATSPAALYNLVFGQVDISFLSLMLLPEALWGLVALIKPQLLIGLGMEAFRSKRAFITTSIIVFVSLSLSFLFFGNWLAKAAELALPLATAKHNVIRFVWPYGIPVGIGLILLGFKRKDHMLYLAGSPFLSPYAHTGSLIGLALALGKHLKLWQFGILWVLWWIAVIFVI